MLGAARDPYQQSGGQNLVFGSESPFNCRPAPFSSFNTLSLLPYRPVFQDAKLSMASTKPMDSYSPFVTWSIGVSGDQTSTWPVNPASVKSQEFSMQSLPNTFNWRSHHRQRDTVI